MQSWNTKTDVLWCSWVSKTKWKYSRSMNFMYFIYSVQSMRCRVESFANCRGYLVGLLVTHCWVYILPAKYLFSSGHYAKLYIEINVHLLSHIYENNFFSYYVKQQYPKLVIPFVTAMRHIFLAKAKARLILFSPWLQSQPNLCFLAVVQFCLVCLNIKWPKHHRR